MKSKDKMNNQIKKQVREYLEIGELCSLKNSLD